MHLRLLVLTALLIIPSSVYAKRVCVHAKNPFKKNKEICERLPGDLEKVCKKTIGTIEHAAKKRTKCFEVGEAKPEKLAKKTGDDLPQKEQREATEESESTGIEDQFQEATLELADNPDDYATTLANNALPSLLHNMALSQSLLPEGSNDLLRLLSQMAFFSTNNHPVLDMLNVNPMMFDRMFGYSSFRPASYGMPHLLDAYNRDVNQGKYIIDAQGNPVYVTDAGARGFVYSGDGFIHGANASSFGYSDKDDNGQGTPVLGKIHTNNKTVKGASLPIGYIKNIAAQNGYSTSLKNRQTQYFLRSLRVQLVNVTPEGQRSVTVPLVDVGPKDWYLPGDKYPNVLRRDIHKGYNGLIDLTYGAKEALGMSYKAGSGKVSFRVLVPDGNSAGQYS